MKKLLLLITILIPIFGFSQLSWQGGTTPEETDSAVLLFDSTGTPLESYSGTIYAHTGVTIDDTTNWVNVIGDWGNNSNQPSLSHVSGNVYSLDLTPSIQSFYSNPSGTITGIDIVLRADTGSPQSADLNINVGAFQVTMINPNSSNLIIVSSGGQTQIIAQNSNGAANYELFVNGSSFHTATTTFYQSAFITNITDNKYCELRVTQGGSIISKFFTILVNGTTSQTLPAGMENGINYTSNTTATLVLDAPLKDFIYVAGSFNSWEPTSAHAMKQDATSGKFWVELTGLTSGQIETYQYWVVEETPITDSPKLVKTADPFSTLVLSPFDDPWIPATTYPNLPAYPSGQEREVTVLQTGQTAYNWQVTNFSKPKKEDLVIYEVLIRDFDADRNFQDLIDKIDYFKNLNINAIELNPIMEFEGNESWGYNPSFHLALDKFYGTENKFREFVDTCHQNGIAVILDIALNHAFGRNPMNRMWMNDPEGDGWGDPSSENPYFNVVATHSYSVGSDFNHTHEYNNPGNTSTNPITNYYVERVIKRWIEDFKIDGFRWDLTKGFTQDCSSGDDTCTESYHADRVAILKQYVDYSWSLDPDHYAIFEHLGSFNGSYLEGIEWADYRIGEGKGIMMWTKMIDQYAQLAMGYNSDNDISYMGHIARGYMDKRAVGYFESHDEERIMYRNLQFGNSSNGSHDVKDLNTALSRMSAIGAVSLTIPGPKMIWHFGELGMENSIFTCSDGSYDNDGCKLDTKPQPQWVNNWLGDANRNQIYNDWSRLNALKINEDVFEGDYSITSNTLQPRIFIWDDAIPASQLKNVVILANFDVTAQNVTPDFPYTGIWYDLMDETGSTTINVTSTTNPINIQPGQFKIYGNQAAFLLSLDEFDEISDITIYPNPVNNTFSVNTKLNSLSIYDVTGKLIKEFKGSFSNGELFDVSNLRHGLYIVKLENNLGQKTSVKLIKY